MGSDLVTVPDPSFQKFKKEGKKEEKKEEVESKKREGSKGGREREKKRYGKERIDILALSISE